MTHWKKIEKDNKNPTYIKTVLGVELLFLPFCILRHPTADFAEQNGRNAKLIGHRPLPL